jgi:hypothetical protein
MSPGEIVELQKSGAVSESLKPYAVLAQEEGLALVSAQGGLENISEPRLVLIRDTVRLGIVLRALVAKFLQGEGDPEVASKIGTLVGARRASLQALGLERISRELDLQSYIAQRAAQDAAEAENAEQSDAESTGADDRASVATEGGESGTVPLRAAPAHALNTDSPTERPNGGDREGGNP